MKRREWMQRTSATLGSLASGGLASAGLVGCGGEAAQPRTIFVHGVASGDPLPDRVILWTRVTAPEGMDEIAVDWTVARDPNLRDVVSSGSVQASATRDFTVKVDAEGLSAGTTYYYAFEALGEASLTGRTRTAPAGLVDRLRLGVVSCSNYAHGYFHVYRHVAEDTDLDLVLHLGDYIYEYGDGEYGRDRTLDPAHEILTLDDYRRRYKHYRLDTDLQAAHQQHAFVCVWDDHETANNAWSGGAGNHDPLTEGSYAERKAVAYQVYAEYMPIREEAVGKIWRSFSYGGLLDLFMLDTRIYGRDEQIAASDRGDPSREILGTEQQAWLTAGLQASSAGWKVLGQQVMLGQLSSSADSFSPLNSDQWDGYVFARERLLEALAPVEGVIVLTGDIHTSWAMDITPTPSDATTYDPATGEGSLAVEFVTTSVTSNSGFDARVAPSFERSLMGTNRHIKHVDLVCRGWLTLDLTPARAQADFFVVDGVTPQAGEASHLTSWYVDAGTRHLREADGALGPRDDAPAAAPDAPARVLPVPPEEEMA